MFTVSCSTQNSTQSHVPTFSALYTFTASLCDSHQRWTYVIHSFRRAECGTRNKLFGPCVLNPVTLFPMPYTHLNIQDVTHQKKLFVPGALNPVNLLCIELRTRYLLLILTGGYIFVGSGQRRGQQIGPITKAWSASSIYESRIEAHIKPPWWENSYCNVLNITHTSSVSRI